MEKLKAELHAHSLEDPYDHLKYPATTLIDRLASEEFKVLALTLHGRQYCPRELKAYAADRGITLIPGVEAFIEGRHTLLYNFDFDPSSIRTFSDVRRYKRDDCLVIAPHPFYPQLCCLRSQVQRHADIFDALEYCHFYSRGINFFNQIAERKARELGLPLVGTSDIHSLSQVGRTYSIVTAENSVEGVIESVKRGAVEVVSHPIRLPHLASTVGEIIAENARRLVRKWYGSNGGSGLAR